MCSFYLGGGGALFFLLFLDTKMLISFLKRSSSFGKIVPTQEIIDGQHEEGKMSFFLSLKQKEYIQCASKRASRESSAS